MALFSRILAYWNFREYIILKSEDNLFLINSGTYIWIFLLQFSVIRRQKYYFPETQIRIENYRKLHRKFLIGIQVEIERIRIQPVRRKILKGNGSRFVNMVKSKTHRQKRPIAYQRLRAIWIVVASKKNIHKVRSILSISLIWFSHGFTGMVGGKLKEKPHSTSHREISRNRDTAY